MSKIGQNSMKKWPFFAIILPWMANYGSECFLLVFSVRDDMVKVSCKSDAGKSQNQPTPPYVDQLSERYQPLSVWLGLVGKPDKRRRSMFGIWFACKDLICNPAFGRDWKCDACDLDGRLEPLLTGDGLICLRSGGRRTINRPHAFTQPDGQITMMMVVMMITFSASW